jgi:hypothetical protein
MIDRKGCCQRVMPGHQVILCVAVGGKGNIDVSAHTPGREFAVTPEVAHHLSSLAIDIRFRIDARSTEAA